MGDIIAFRGHKGEMARSPSVGEGRPRRVTGHKAINEKYAFDPSIRSLTRAYGTPAK